MSEVTERTGIEEQAEAQLTPAAAREYVDGLSPSDLVTLSAAVRRRLERERIGDGGIGPDGDGEADPLAGWNYERQPWRHGHIQRDPKQRKMKDGTTRVYGYWYFHWIEAGARKSKYIGSDDALANWKQSNPR